MRFGFDNQDNFEDFEKEVYKEKIIKINLKRTFLQQLVRNGTRRYDRIHD
jgi:hypothetical protein